MGFEIFLQVLFPVSKDSLVLNIQVYSWVGVLEPYLGLTLKNQRWTSVL